MPKKNFLYTAKQISEMEVFGPKETITPWKITQNWVKNGLKFIKGTKKEYLFKIEWINEFIEIQACNNQKQATKSILNTKTDVKKEKFTKVY